MVTMVVPAGIFLFLRGFGQNEFTIPVYYQHGLSFTGCNTATSPHKVLFATYADPMPHLFYFPQWVQHQNFYRETRRIHAKYPAVQFTAIADTIVTPAIGNVWIVDTPRQLLQIANCELAWGEATYLTAPDRFNQLVLVDKHNHIRGYYKGDSLEDMDRLDIELDILLNHANE